MIAPRRVAVAINHFVQINGFCIAFNRIELRRAIAHQARLHQVFIGSCHHALCRLQIVKFSLLLAYRHLEAITLYK